MSLAGRYDALALERLLEDGREANLVSSGLDGPMDGFWTMEPAGVDEWLDKVIEEDRRRRAGGIGGAS